MTTTPGPGAAGGSEGPGAAGAAAGAADPGEPDAGLARERTALAWIRTAISFAAVGGVVLKHEVLPGLVILALTPVVWYLGRMTHSRQERFKLMSATIVAVALIALAVSFTA
jgi:uncharacterized membrane protein YidH (DUF202 family)